MKDKWFNGHVVTWPANSIILWVMFRPRWTWPQRDYKRGHTAINVAGNVTSSIVVDSWRTWPIDHVRGRQRGQKGWPLRATFRVFQLFSFFIDFFVFQCRYQSQTLFAKVRTLKTQKPFENHIFHQLFSKRKTPKWESENMLRASNWLTMGLVIENGTLCAECEQK